MLRRSASAFGLSSIEGMSLWLLLVLLAAVKVPLAVLMLWIPLRSDEAMSAREDASAARGEDDGGSKTLPGAPGDRHPRHPHDPRPIGPRRRGPRHGSPASPPRVRHGASVGRSRVGRLD